MADVSLSHLVDVLGPSVLRVMCAPAGLEHAVGEPELLDAADPTPSQKSALLLGIGLRLDDDRIAEVVEAAGRDQAAALVLKCRGESPAALAELAERFHVAVLDAAPDMPWRRLEALCATVLRGRPGQASADLAHVPNGDLFALANAVAAIAGGATAIMDANKVVIAYSDLDGQRVDDTRARSILSRRVPQEAYSAFLEPAVWNSGNVVKVRRPGDMDRIAVVVRAGSEVLGSLWVAVEDDTDTAECEAALREAAKFAALHLLQLRRHAGAEQERRDRALRAALESGGDGAGLGLPGHLLALTSPGAGGADATRRRTSFLQLEDMIVLDSASFGFSIAAALIGDRLYVLVPAHGGGRRQAAIFARHVIDRAAASLRRDFLSVLSADAATAAELRVQRADCDSALAYLARTGMVSGSIDIESVRTDLVLHRIASLVAERPDLRSGLAERVARHDAVKGSRYADSLHAYLRCFGDIVAASESLHIHQNTMRQRLRRAEQIFGIDLRSPDGLLLLWIELAALRG